MKIVPRSLRWRLQLWYGAWLAAVLTAFTASAFALVRDSRLRRIDAEIERRMVALGAVFRPPLRDALRPPGPEGRPWFRPGERRPAAEGRSPEEAGAVSGGGPAGGRRPGEPPFFAPPAGAMEALEASLFSQDGPDRFYYRILGHDRFGERRSAGAPPDVPRPAPPPMDFVVRQTAEVREHVRRLRGGTLTLTVGKYIGPDLAELRRLSWILSAAAAGIWALGGGGGAWIAARAIRPVETIGHTAQRIAAGDLSRRIPVAETDTELGRLAEVLNATFDRLCEALARQTRFTADASHELRTPVSVILSQVESVLARPRPAEEYREALEACMRAARRLRHLVESLLTLARFDSGAPAGERERVELDGVAAEALALLRPLASERRLELVADLAPTACVGRRDQLLQMAVNLVSNAIHYNRPRGRVEVRTWTDGDARLEVRDNGIGIRSEDLPHIFERFFRADPARGAADGRAGLGLAITRTIVEAHGGQVEVESREGEGSRFTVRLPSHPEPLAPDDAGNDTRIEKTNR